MTTRLGAMGLFGSAIFLAGSYDGMGSARAQDGGCEPSGDLEYICGPVNAEDLVQLGDSQWLIASGMSGGLGPEPAGEGHLYLVDRERKTYEDWFPGDDPAMRQDEEIFGACPGPVDTGNFSPHGLALSESGGDSYRLYITSHGAREAIEVFDVDASGAEPSVAWIGCVPLAETISSNSVAVLSDGGFITTKMMDPTAPDGFAGVLSGDITGELYEWHPGGEVQAVPGTELSGANGIALSPDERYIYVAAIGSREIVRYDRGEAEPGAGRGVVDVSPLAKESVAIAVRPDNLRWSDEGTLYTVGGDFVPPEECANPPCASGWSVIEVDPDTLETRRVTGVDASAALQGASTALPVDDEIWIGTYSGDRIGYLPKP